MAEPIYCEPICCNRRAFLRAASASISAVALQRFSMVGAEEPAKADDKRKPTVFQHACMTLPYTNFSLERALKGIKSAGFEFVAWGTTHKNAEGKSVPVIAADAAPDVAKELAMRCHDSGLQPVMMFSMVYPEHDGAVEVLTQRLKQASAAGISQVLTFGHTEGGDRKLWIERFKKLGPIARDQGVTLVVKQHGGSTGTGAVLAEITREVADDGIKVNYDAGNVMDYLDVDPIPDILKCADEVRSFCIKDHRRWPKKGDCGPGFGEIDHYKLLHPVAFTGRTMPLAYENIFEPIVPRPQEPEAINALARRAREYVETVLRGLQETTP